MTRRTIVSLLLVAVAVVAGVVLGQRAVIVSGRSMLPDARTGDVVLVWPAADYRVGDAAVFEVPDGQPGAGARVYHRIVDERDGVFVFQGDNNPYPDPWDIAADDVVGREVVRIPRVGLLIPFLRQPAAMAALAAGLAAAWATARTARRDDDPADSADEASANATATSRDIDISLRRRVAQPEGDRRGWTSTAPTTRSSPTAAPPTTTSPPISSAGSSDSPSPGTNGDRSCASCATRPASGRAPI